MLRGLGSVRGLGWINAKAAERAVIGDNTSKWKVRFTKEITELSCDSLCYLDCYRNCQIKIKDSYTVGLFRAAKHRVDPPCKHAKTIDIRLSISKWQPSCNG